MEAVLYFLTILCCVLIGMLITTWREQNEIKKQIKTIPTPYVDPYEKEIRNLFAYGGDEKGQVKLDED